MWLGSARPIRSARAGHQRRAVSLVELLVALALFGVVGGALLRSFDRQARLHRGLTRILETHGQLTATVDIVATELRSAHARGDVLALSDTAVAYRATIGVAVACAIAAGVVDLLPASLPSGRTLSAFRSAPQTGDTVWLHDEGPTAALTDDGWFAAPVTGIILAAGACDGTPFVAPGTDAGTPTWRLSLGGALPPPGVRAGSVARLTRHARFALYRAGNGDANLGWAEWNAAANRWNVIQPASGPLRGFQSAAPAASGFTIEARDSTGAPITLHAGRLPSALIVTARAATTVPIRIEGMARGAHPDSLRTLVTLRNRQ